MSTYLFVDLSNFIAGYQHTMTTIFGDGTYVPDLQQMKESFGADRVYVYDAIPKEARPKESDEEFQKRRAQAEERLRHFARMDDVIVRSGTQSRSAKLGRQMEQKEVDVLLAVELVTCAFRGTVKHAVLFSGDLDLRPAVHAAVEAGTRVTVACFRHQVSRDAGLVEAADRWVPLRVAWCVKVAEHTCRPATLQVGSGGSRQKMYVVNDGPSRGLQLARLHNNCIQVYEQPLSWYAEADVAAVVLKHDYDVDLPPEV